MSDIEHARAMLRMAESDLKALQGMLHPSLFGYAFFSDAIFGFHAQQAAEKCLKAWIASKGMSFPRTHDLMALIEILGDADVTDELDDLVDLNAFAVEYRYQVHPDEDPIDRDQILARMTSVFERVRALLEQ